MKNWLRDPGFIDCRLPFRNRDHDRRLWIKIHDRSNRNRWSTHFISIYNLQSAIADRDRPQSITIDHNRCLKLKKSKKGEKKIRKKEQSAHKENCNFLMTVKEGKIMDGSWSCDLDHCSDEIMEILVLFTTRLTFWNILKHIWSAQYVTRINF